MTSIYDFKVSDTNNQSIEMSEYRGKIILIVNVASYCGLTPQYKGLENLYKNIHRIITHFEVSFSFHYSLESARFAGTF